MFYFGLVYWAESFNSSTRKAPPWIISEAWINEIIYSLEQGFKLLLVWLFYTRDWLLLLIVDLLSLGQKFA